MRAEIEPASSWMLVRFVSAEDSHFTQKEIFGVPVVAQWLMNLTRNHEVAGSVPALAQWVNDLALP